VVSYHPITDATEEHQEAEKLVASFRQRAHRQSVEHDEEDEATSKLRESYEVLFAIDSTKDDALWQIPVKVYLPTTLLRSIRVDVTTYVARM
jgi:hypothetical protein